MSDKSSTPSWIFFAAGALIPTITFFLFGNKLRPSVEIDNDDDEEDEDMIGVAADGPSSSWGYQNAPYKMLLIVNQELKMGKGKIAAQCCHAAVGCYKRASKQCPNGVNAWEHTGCAKIAVKCPTQAEMEEIAARAYERDIPLYLVEDAGRTQIAAGSRTVLGLGPAPTSVFEDITSHLKLM
mmetsp:Transcript_25186/g.35289  ORF Transcript_25186/g.35289 Transcript_25186/m.35289 type:complete len:182 (+) Transcript_25186:135-680(+)